MSVIETKPTVLADPQAMRRFAEDTKHTIFQRWAGEDDGVQKLPVKAFVHPSGNYLLVVQDGREILLTTDTANDLMALLVTVRDEAIAIRRKKGAKD